MQRRRGPALGRPDTRLLWAAAAVPFGPRGGLEFKTFMCLCVGLEVQRVVGNPSKRVRQRFLLVALDAKDVNSPFRVCQAGKDIEERDMKHYIILYHTISYII